jgi:signal transduction histidine kinase
MNRSYKLSILLIFVLSIVITSFFSYKASSSFDMLIVLGIAFIGAILIGGGFVKLLIEPLQKRSFELELLSRQTLHELNIPVATILANTQMLLKKEHLEKNIKRLKRIEQASETLKTLYKELDYMIKKQIHRVELEECDLKELINIRILSYEELFPQINFEHNLEKSIVKIDIIGFFKVIDNLIHNAVKYSKPNSIVKITLKDKKLSVKDEGIGIDEDFVFKAFENYYQEDKSSSGQGIGLGLVKEYCDRYKIKIYLDSKKQEGTTVTLDFSSGSIDAVN